MTHTGLLRLWVIYERPRDYPDGFVIRGRTLRVVTGTVEDIPDEAAWYADTLNGARLVLHERVPGLARLPREPNDEPQIVEVWV